MEHLWWQRGVVYQIYPRSFQDSDGDGVGDLRGVIERLDYLVWLGIDALWLSPIYPSPMADFGYDVSDYTDIHPMFGDLEVFDRLVAEAHVRGLKVLLDFVPNHTSDRHPWFLESRRSRENDKRDWYIWRDPAPDGGVPNNWLSNFGGPAWTFDETTGQYYYHAFLSAQPDLNWRNPAVREAMHDVLRFWLRHGVDGFRVDVIFHLMKDEELRANPPNPGWQEGMRPYDRLLPIHSSDHPEVHDVIAGLRRTVDEFDDRVLIGEIYLPIERLVMYYGEGLGGVHLPFNFQLISTPWVAPVIAELIAEYEHSLPEGGWPNWVLGNHDNSRIASRIGPAQARVAALLLLTLRGTPTLYYGDEIGLLDVSIPPDRVQDPFEKQVPGLGVGRDPARTPMQWDASEHAGFTTGEPWLPLAADYAENNVERQRGDPTSMLTLHRRLLALRRETPALCVGAITLQELPAPLLAFERLHAGTRLLVIANLAAVPHTIRTGDIAALASEGAVVIFSTYLDRDDDPVGDQLPLRADEGVIVRLA